MTLQPLPSDTTLAVHFGSILILSTLESFDEIFGGIRFKNEVRTRSTQLKGLFRLN